MRDRDSLESELLELRLMAHAIGNGLRKLASGDVHQQIEAPLPHNFEGMRKDYNRGLASIASATEDIASHANELRAQSHELREVLQQVAEGGAHQEDMVKNAIAVLGGALDTSHGQSSHVDHIATIVHNARTDMDRPKQISMNALGDTRQTCRFLSQLQAIANETRLALNSPPDPVAAGDGAGPVRTDRREGACDPHRHSHEQMRQIADAVERMCSLTQQALESATSTFGGLGILDREFEAMELYLEATGRQVQALGETTTRETALIETVRTDLSSLGRKALEGKALPHPPLLHLDAIDRTTAEISRQADRFKSAGIIPPHTTPPPPSGAKRPHLRLVKS